jgi:hypothetical protein
MTERFTRQEWFALPLKFRQRWWRETDFSRRQPSPELLTEARRLLESRSDDAAP